ncbi:MAG TPA: glycosyltransferase family 2 protein [Pseudorhodoferax sp.]|nr:glycosyltransferase family 2 protein [Pseudorhodoferax sp.]
MSRAHPLEEARTAGEAEGPPMNTPYVLSVVVPAYNEQEVLPEFQRRMLATLRGLGCAYEIVYVNDGSRDTTLEVMHQLRAEDACVSVVDLSRNFGKEIALTAGLDQAVGDAIVVIDADLQDPPELIPELVRQWQAGYDMVYAKRTVRDGESWFKKLTAKLFYRLVRRLTRIDMPADTGDFRLLSRRALDALLRLREQHRFMKGLFAWVGFPSVAVPYRRDPRFAGTTKWNYWKLWNLAVEGLTSFTIGPLKLATYIGFVVASFGFLYAAMIVYRTLLHGDPVPGYPSLMVTVLFLGGVQLVAIGTLGEYVGRIFNEVKGRPLYLLKGFAPSAAHADRAEDASTRDAS